MLPLPRPVRADDLPRLLVLYGLLLGRPLTLEGLTARTRRLPDSAHWLIEDSEGVLALCDWEPNDFGPPGSLRLNLLVRPDARGRGYGSARLNLAGQTGALLCANVPDNDPRSLTWAEQRGFTCHAHRFESALDLRTLKPARHPASLPEDVTLGDMVGASTEAWDELTKLLIETFAQTPDARGLPNWSDATARREVQLSPQMRPEWLICARHGDQLIGFTAALNMPGMAYNQMTGVAEAARGLGLAVALKVELLRRLKAAGVRQVRTHNHAANVAMRRVNEKLGYRQQHGRWEVRRGP